MLAAIRNYMRRIDLWIAALCVLSSAISIVLLCLIHQTFPEYFGRRMIIVQAAASLVGIAAMLILALVDYKILTKLWFIHYPLCVLFVLLTFFFGVGREGADDKAWLDIFGISVQPSEFLKLSLILTFAHHADAVKDNVNSFASVVRLCFFGLLPCFLVVMQGDDGSAMVFLFVFVCMIFAAGISYKLVAAAAGLVAVAVPLIWNFVLNNDQKLRFLVLFDDSVSPSVVYQQNAGLRAMSYGGVWGSQNYSYVPEMHNDMIFSFIGNALGFFGSCLVVTILVVICIRTLLASRGTDEGIQAKIACAGVFGMIAFQTVLNIGMNLKLLPVVGITLPFFSAGGSSVLMTYISIGIVMSIYRQNHLKTLY